MDYYDLLSRKIPQHSPEEERTSAYELAGMLNSLGRYVTRFRNAVALFHFAKVRSYSAEESAPRVEIGSTEETHARMREMMRAMQANMREMQQYSEWQRIAARDCALTIFHFSKTLGAVDGYWPKSVPSLKGKIDFPLKKQAETEFSAAFPFAGGLRHTVAHQAEFATPTRIAEHMISGPYDGFDMYLEEGATVSVSEDLSDDIYASTFEGKMFHIAINDGTVAKLSGVRDEYLQAFTEFLPDEAKGFARMASST
ncbi:hypothetical protein [Sinorhizobium fredii]|uniref:hypothetical protein n=1 Tax=Rhizobium fredii TaxID=380 RepID=UPI00339134AD